MNPLEYNLCKKINKSDNGIVIWLLPCYAMSSVENSVSYPSHHWFCIFDIRRDWGITTAIPSRNIRPLTLVCGGTRNYNVHIRCVEKSTQHFINYLFNILLLLFMLCVYRPEENMPLNEVASEDKPPEYKEREEEDSRRNSTEKLPPA